MAKNIGRYTLFLHKLFILCLYHQPTQITNASPHVRLFLICEVKNVETYFTSIRTERIRIDLFCLSIFSSFLF